MIRVEEAVEKIKQGIRLGESIIFGALCQISYSGRAESYLPLGDRIFIIKPDGTFLVHQPSGANPVNYMKAGSSYEIRYGLHSNYEVTAQNAQHEPGEQQEINEAKKVVLKSSNIPLKEFIEVDILYFHFVYSGNLKDSAKIQLQGTEKDMSDMIMRNPALVEHDFKPFSQEEHTKYGFIDVFGTDKKGNIVAVECKRYSADFKAVSQLQRYVERLKKAKGVNNVRGVLASPKISPNALAMLEEIGFEWRSITPPKYLEKFNAAQTNLSDFSENLPEN